MFILENIKKRFYEKQMNTTVAGLVGHTNVLYYNYGTNTWNTNQYNGYTINGTESDIGNVKEFKSVMEKIHEFGAQYEMAAIAVMTIGSRLFLDWGIPVANPQYSEKGAKVVSNIIVKNKTTGKYELYCKSWVGVDNFCFSDLAACDGIFRFAYCGVWLADFRRALIDAHTL